MSIIRKGKEPILTKRLALEYSLIQWDYIVMNGCPKNIAIKKMDLPETETDCFLCEYNEITGDECPKCLVKWREGMGCLHGEFGDWLTNRSKENAKIIVDLILESYNKEFPERWIEK